VIPDKLKDRRAELADDHVKPLKNSWPSVCEIRMHDDDALKLNHYHAGFDACWQELSPLIEELRYHARGLDGDKAVRLLKEIGIHEEFSN